MQDKINDEIEELKKDIQRLGKKNTLGKFSVPFGQLFDDEKAQQYYEALVGTLKAAKKQGVVDFQGQILLKGQHDKIEIILNQE
ncbi:hypothetical protein IMG5_051560 [Ichthyophthirius multifiliis]|uniref:Costars domain-containing protein n=1 Tax=Ichthyophthirius multifiliis TaxID=5932 RepID=G0QMS5_ICHMU|nr:hypothetical protein IMG5_051560 [Ichthyophthirius multifiliis]EGR33478.1 hypothetical protein IMG5_051560 [Ichthyophthirius multifiliis]|eukprot:XP_004037464.1 hypothetical protein IMG5_051560 [Ichthyophthirius multifiliis]